MNAVVITVSDSCFAGSREDISGPRVAARLRLAGFTVEAIIVVADEQKQIALTLRQQSARARLVVTTGGTGIAARDVTPEATRSVCDRILDGFSERMRSEGLKDTPLAPLSRAVCGTLGNTLVLNVPGSPRGAVQSLEAVLGLVPHALALLAGDTEHHAPPTAGPEN
ncbi:MAG: MogA/MoaB family molybdenum cofactor biosynthesis protein [Acidobacteriaceae bacterium]